MPMPITETGYLSRFTGAAIPAWRRGEAAARQYTLF